MNKQLLADWNPWWASGKVPEVLKRVERRTDPLIFRSLEEPEITVLTGIRRAGKTTTMYQMIDALLNKLEPTQILYVNLDDEGLRHNTLKEIFTTYRQEKNPDKKAVVFFDEIQNKDGWERLLKTYYDKREPVKFVISGSSSTLLKGEYSTLLTGRNLTFEIRPLSFAEYLDFNKVGTENITSGDKSKIIHLLNEYLEYGGFPEVYFKEKEIKKILLKQYFEDILYKDVIYRHDIHPEKITTLAVYLLTNISNLYTIRKIRDFTGLSIDSIRDYISFLEEAFMVSTTNNFSYSFKESKHIKHPKKAYCADTGLRNVVGTRFSRDSGHLAENLVYKTLERQKTPIYYWKGKNEVDFVIKRKPGTLEAINVTYTDTIAAREIKGLLEFKVHSKSKPPRLTLLTRDTEKRENGINFVPLWKWLLSH